MKREAPKVELEEDNGEEEPTKKKGCKQKLVYGKFKIFTDTNYSFTAGVDNDKWNVKKKVKPTVAALIAKTNEQVEFLKREEVYEANRPELTVVFRF